MKNRLRLVALLLLLSVMLSLFAVGASAASVSVESNEAEEIVTEELALIKLSPEGARALLIILASIFGLLLPLAPITVFALKFIKKRNEFEFVDYVIIGISAVWLISGAIIFAMIL
ncbi:MAG: hypothetical protein IKL79_00230 [Clostridia bacterium]|nr:hypothetical protein [Clostridia bacterium]